jgi:hypothetical protein
VFRVSAELLRSIYCAFGANKLFIYRALDRVLEHLEARHGLMIGDHETRRRVAREAASQAQRERSGRIDLIAARIRDGTHGSRCAALLATAKTTEFQRRYSWAEAEQDRTTAAEAFQSALTDAYEELSTELPELDSQELEEAADRALEMARQDETAALVERIRRNDE